MTGNERTPRQLRINFYRKFDNRWSSTREFSPTPEKAYVGVRISPRDYENERLRSQFAEALRDELVGAGLPVKPANSIMTAIRRDDIVATSRQDLAQLDRKLIDRVDQFGPRSLHKLRAVLADPSNFKS